MKPRVLFILKHRPAGAPGSWSYSCGGDPLSSGLAVSVQQMVIALEELGMDAKAVHVIDNNFIHREVVAYRPTHVIIEGYWVVPSKFDELQKAVGTQGVKWIVRCHSNTEFLAHEGTVFGWTLDYLEKGVTVGFNSPDAARVFRSLAKISRTRVGQVAYLPNYYSFEHGRRCVSKEMLKHLTVPKPAPVVPGYFQIGCYGAIRPLKNTMNQALAAIIVANRLGLRLRFHVNSSRVENQGDALLRSLRSLFERMGPTHMLCEDGWLPHDEFLQALKSIDVVMQVSMSETFNLVSADAVSQKVPVVTANVPWMPKELQADPVDVEDIANKLHHTWIKSGNGTVQESQHWALVRYVSQTKSIWRDFLNY